VSDGDASVAGLLDLQGAVQQEVAVEPSVLALPLTANSPSRIDQAIRVRNLSTRRVPVRIRSAETPGGVEVTPLRVQMLLAPGQARDVRVRFKLEDFEPGQVGGGEVEIVVRGSPVARVPYVFSRPSPDVDMLSQVSLQTTGERTTDVTPAVVSFVAGAIGDAANPAIRPVGELEVQLWRGGRFRGVLSVRRELLPGRYAFGLTGRGPRGERLPRGNYLVRLVARPEDGTRRQVESVDYPVR
jgi:hypothetical protein